MHFIDLKSYGTPDVLFLNQGPKPSLNPDEVLIEVKAAGVNRPDILQRAGHYPIPPDATPILGLEIAGVIVEKGSDTNLWEVGDAVCALTNGGGYAQFCSVPETQCLPIPKPLSFIEAASLPETYFTVWGNVFERGKLRRDETILIHAGASGIGSTAIQLAKAFHATVITTTSSDFKADFCKSLHADFVINYKKEDFENKVLEITENRGVDLILDIVGGDYFPKNISLLNFDGRLLQISFLSGRKAILDLAIILQKRLIITGSALRPQSKESKGKLALSLTQHVWPLFNQGIIKPTVSAVFALKDAAKAHTLLESNTVLGKIVLNVES